MILQQLVGHALDLVTLPDQTAGLVDNHAEHDDRRRIKRHRQPDRGLRCLTDIPEQPRLGDFSTDDIPGGLDEGVMVEGGDDRRCRNTVKEGEEPFAAAVVAEAFDLRELERQVVRLESV